MPAQLQGAIPTWSLWCPMELQGAQPGWPWVVALIASHQTGPCRAWACASRAAWRTSELEWGRVHPVGLWGDICIACQAFREAAEGALRALLPGRLWVWGVVELKPWRGLGSSQQGTCTHQAMSSLKVCLPLLDKEGGFVFSFLKI